MKIKSKNQYSLVLREIDVLLELSFLNQNETKKLKNLLDALDHYQNTILSKSLDAISDLAKEFLLRGNVVLN
jgi:hypothetical protein|tara:strand:- start:38 stop:253 length:216 start_codon:yes stop_codon:yes gene_type:complete